MHAPAGGGTALWGRGTAAAEGAMGADHAHASKDRPGRHLAAVRDGAGAVREPGPAALPVHPHRLHAGAPPIQTPLLPWFQLENALNQPRQFSNAAVQSRAAMTAEVLHAAMRAPSVRPGADDSIRAPCMAQPG